MTGTPLFFLGSVCSFFSCLACVQLPCVTLKALQFAQFHTQRVSIFCSETGDAYLSLAWFCDRTRAKASVMLVVNQGSKAKLPTVATDEAHCNAILCFRDSGDTLTLLPRLAVAVPPGKTLRSGERVAVYAGETNTFR